ncbi:MAG: cell division protein FtsQ/DivIB [Caulobacterales bacterium]
MPPVKRRRKHKSNGPVKMGAWARAKGRSVARGDTNAPAIFGAAMLLGGMTLFAAWMGGSLGDIWMKAETAVDDMVKDSGFAAKKVSIVGVEGVREMQLRDTLGFHEGDALLRADPISLRDRAMSLEWVGQATALRLWPDQVVMIVEPREPFALWRVNNKTVVTDASGHKLLSSDPLAHPELPLVEGVGAGPAAGGLMLALEASPTVRDRLAYATYVGERRWNLKLKTGLDILLPETHPEGALERLETMHAERGVLDLPMQRLDLRSGDRIYAAPAPSSAHAAGMGE